jgi:peptide/nickel transport system substrate-binding protein
MKHRPLVSRVILVFTFVVFSLPVVVFTPVAYSASPRHGGTFIYALEGEQANLNPFLISTSDVVPIQVNLYSTLLTQDLNSNFVPSLAESYRVSADGLTYTFRLVKNATWHDGKPCTSADVVYTLKELYPQNPRTGAWWKPNANVVVEAPDSTTVVLKLKQPYAPLLDLIAYPTAGPFILPKHLYEGTEMQKNPYNSKPIGTGPFMFKEWVRGSHIELVRNPNYFAKGNEGKPFVDRVVFRMIPDPAGRMLALKKGDVDFVPYNAVPFEDVPDLRKDPNLVIDTRGAGGSTIKYLFINLRNPLLSNKMVRQAIAYAIDKKKIVDLVLLGEGKEAKSVINSVTKWAFNPKAPEYPFSLEKANTLLDKAGYPRAASGTRFKIRLSCIGGRGSDIQIAEVMRDQLKQVGIEAQIMSTDRTSFSDALFMRWDFDLAIQQAATAPDPMVGLTRLLHTRYIVKAALTNSAGFSNPEVDKLLDEEYKQINKEKRAAMWYRIQEIVMDELPYFPIYEQPVLNVHRSVWADTITSIYGHNQSREHAYLKK